MACTETELIAIDLERQWTRVNYYYSTYFTIPEIQDTGSIALGDPDGLYCGPAVYTLVDGQGYIFEALGSDRDFELRATDES